MKGVSSPILNSEESWMPSRSSAHPQIVPKRTVFEHAPSGGNAQKAEFAKCGLFLDSGLSCRVRRKPVESPERRIAAEQRMPGSVTEAKKT